ncbi:MAG: histidine kinase [Hydrogenophilales bacterium RIFOXYD1_FULL_62_11]|nr:MAG: histidine kinase [Hydrogenophilales bacterium RIFOXYD1_FULL_62_11]
MALLIGMLVASYMQASTGLEALKQFGISSQHADHLDRVHTLFIERQSATRGYALTREPAYLASYRETATKIQDSLKIVRQDHQNHLQTETAELILQAQAMAAHMDVVVARIERGEPLEKAWFDQGALEMEAYKRQHNAMKAALLTENLENVRQSMKGFENARISMLLLAVASLLLLVVAISQKQQQQELLEKIQHMLAAENERLERDVRHRTEELTSLATYLTEVRETEKQNLARELHDELGALLTAAKLDADWIERTLPPESRTLVAQRMARLRQSLIGGITLKRRITSGLRPALLYDLGLIEALKALIEEFRQIEGIEVKADLPEAEPEFSEACLLSLFRIVQEAFTNIRKYAQARHVDVSLRVTPTTIELTIEDDGVGFDLDSPKLARHGLAGIKHRVFTHGGQLDIRTAPGTGVMLRAILPA